MNISETHLPLPFISSIFKNLCKKHNIKFYLEPHYQYTGYFVSLSGNRCFFNNTKLDINRIGATSIATDKAFCNHFLHEDGFDVPHSAIFFSPQYLEKMYQKNHTIFTKLPDIKTALQFIETHGFPIFIKPNLGSQGEDVYRVCSHEQFQTIYQDIIKRHEQLLIQSEVKGNDYRVLVLKDTIICAYKRTPLHVIGDGITNLQKLFENKITLLRKQQDGMTIQNNDPRIHAYLKTQGLKWKDVIKKDHIVNLLASANLSTAGQMEDVTHCITDDIKTLCIRATHSLGLTLAGIDIMSKDITDSHSKPTIIEVNASPSTYFYYRCEKNDRQKIIDLYEKIFHILIHS